MGLADELLDDAEPLAQKGISEKRPSCMRRAVSTAYYSIFHLLVEDFVSNWPFLDQRARLARMFDHSKMRNAAFTPVDKNNLTPTEKALDGVRRAFGELQKDRHKADYEVSWIIVETDVKRAVTLARDTFVQWRSIRTEDVARNYLLSMFGANR